MIDLKLDSTTHDISIENNDLVLISEVDELVQNLKIRLLTFYGEWFEDSRIGVRYFEDILVKTPDLTKISVILKECILSTDGVNQLLSFTTNFDRQARTLTVTFQIDTDYGPVDMTDFPIGV